MTVLLDVQNRTNAGAVGGDAVGGDARVGGKQVMSFLGIVRRIARNFDISLQCTKTVLGFSPSQQHRLQ